MEDPVNGYLQMIDLHLLKEKFAKLPEHHRDILIFRSVYGFKCKEIADLFQMSERTVKSRCHDARKNLKKLLIEDGEYIE